MLVSFTTAALTDKATAQQVTLLAAPSARSADVIISVIFTKRSGAHETSIGHILTPEFRLKKKTRDIWAQQPMHEALLKFSNVIFVQKVMRNIFVQKSQTNRSIKSCGGSSGEF